MMELRYCFTGDVYIVWDGNEILAMFDKNFDVKMCRDLTKLADVREELKSLVLEDAMDGRR